MIAWAYILPEKYGIYVASKDLKVQSCDLFLFDFLIKFFAYLLQRKAKRRWLKSPRKLQRSSNQIQHFMLQWLSVDV